MTGMRLSGLCNQALSVWQVMEGVNPKEGRMFTGAPYCRAGYMLFTYLLCIWEGAAGAALGLSVQSQFIFGTPFVYSLTV